MTRFTDPATSESPSSPLPTNQRSLEDLMPAHVAAIMRSIDGSIDRRAAAARITARASP